MINKLTSLFSKDNAKLLNVYFTAGYPTKQSTAKVLIALQHSGVDVIEIGMPYSDPIADGPVIQNSNQVAIANGITIPVLFEQLENCKAKIAVPLILMGYLNPVLQYGFAAFCKKAASVGISGIILPDMPMYEYENTYKHIFTDNNLTCIFLITPQTSIERIKAIDKHSHSFIYAVSSNAITGTQANTAEQEIYFKKLQKIKLKNKLMIGFGIHDKHSFLQACKYATGAIVGSAYIKILGSTKDIAKSTDTFVKSLR